MIHRELGLELEFDRVPDPYRMIISREFVNKYNDHCRRRGHERVHPFHPLARCRPQASKKRDASNLNATWSLTITTTTGANMRQSHSLSKASTILYEEDEIEGWKGRVGLVSFMSISFRDLLNIWKLPASSAATISSALLLTMT